MRDGIARALTWVLHVFTSHRPGRHSADYFATHTPNPQAAPVNPWSHPWTGPSSQEVRAIFKDERAQGLPAVQRERLWGSQFAGLGVDYDFPTMGLSSVVTRERVTA